MPHPFFYIKRAIRAAGKPLRKRRRPVPPEVEEIPVFLSNLSGAFEGFRIAVVSDLHLPDSLSSPAQVIDTLTAIAPDCILLPGDIANRYAAFSAEEIAEFLQKLTRLAPCYAITGNHEQNTPHLDAFRALMERAGVRLLYDRWDVLKKNGQALPIYGVCENGHAPIPPIPSPSLLLIHNPACAVRLKDSGFSLALCGHAHGGQIRFGKQGLYAPGQGFFPRYTSGRYTVGSMQLVVSRGLGDSSLPLRLHNPPHLPVIRLQVKPVC